MSVQYRLNPRLAGLGCAGLLFLAVVLVVTPAYYLPYPLYVLGYGWRYPVSRLAGDVELTDRGPRFPGSRFVIDMGEIGQATKFERSFTFSELPPESLLLGLEVTGGEGFRVDRDSHPDIGNIRMQLTNSDGQVVILEDGPLTDWVWCLCPRPDWTFIYKSFGTRVTVLENGMRRLERIGVAKPDDGDGTKFTPRPGQSYKLDVSASFNEDSIRKYKIRLLAQGGGGVPPF
jgi:hypothetical protein